MKRIVDISKELDKRLDKYSNENGLSPEKNIINILENNLPEINYLSNNTNEERDILKGVIRRSQISKFALILLPIIFFWDACFFLFDV